MPSLRVGIVVVSLLVSLTAFGGTIKNARTLCLQLGLDTEQSVDDEFRRLTEKIQERLGRDAWASIQEEALTAIDERRFDHVDPLVGETSCELRALFGFHMAMLRESGSKIDQQEVDLNTFIFILSHALVTKYGGDGFGFGDKNERELLAKFLSSRQTSLDLTGNALADLIEDLQRVVAYGSVMYARNSAAQLGNEVGNALEALFLRQCILDNTVQWKRPVLCCFGVCRLVLEVARKDRIPVVIRTRFSFSEAGGASSGTAIAVYQHDGSAFVALEQTDLAGNAPVLVLDAITTRFGLGDLAPPDGTEVEAYIDGLPFELAWLSGGAVHSQYPGKENIQVKPVATPGCDAVMCGYQTYLEKAVAIGTSKEGPSLHCVTHNYVTTFERAIRYAGRLGREGGDPVPALRLRNGWYYPVQMRVVRSVELSHISIPDDGPIRPRLQLAPSDMPSPRATLSSPAGRWGRYGRSR